MTLFLCSSIFFRITKKLFFLFHISIFRQKRIPTKRIIHIDSNQSTFKSINTIGVKNSNFLSFLSFEANNITTIYIFNKILLCILYTHIYTDMYRYSNGNFFKFLLYYRKVILMTKLRLHRVSSYRHNIKKINVTKNVSTYLQYLQYV